MGGAYFSTLLNLGQLSALLLRTECGRNNKCVSSRAQKKAVLTYWRMRGQCRGNRDAPAKSQHQLQMREWGHLGPSSSATTWLHQVKPAEEPSRQPTDSQKRNKLRLSVLSYYILKLFITQQRQMETEVKTVLAPST